MALDNKQKRGSATHIGLPWRHWLAEPSGDVDYQERISILKFCSAIVSVVVPPEVPGIECLWTGDRLHYKWNETRLHYVWNGDRLHYNAKEESVN